MNTAIFLGPRNILISIANLTLVGEGGGLPLGVQCFGCRSRAVAVGAIASIALRPPLFTTKTWRRDAARGRRPRWPARCAS